jgi:hypothetical protein
MTAAAAAAAAANPAASSVRRHAISGRLTTSDDLDQEKYDFELPKK